MMTCSSEPFSKFHEMQFCTQPPELQLNLQLPLWFLGCFSARSSAVMFPWCFVQLLRQGVITWSRSFQIFLPAAFHFSAFEGVVLSIFLSVPCHLHSSRQPQHIVICDVADLQQLLHLLKCQFHRHYSVSGIIVLLSCYLNSCNACWSCHAIMLFTPKLRLRPKPLQCK